MITPRTNIKKCSVRLRAIAEPLGFKTLGSFQKFIGQCSPNAKLYIYGTGLATRAGQVRRHIQVELKEYKDLAEA